MEQNTMNAVRDAELEAEKIEKSALQQRDSILETARQGAVKLIEAAISAEKATGAGALDVARGQGEALQQQAIESVKQDIAALRQAADAKCAQARQLVRGALI